MINNDERSVFAENGYAEAVGKFRDVVNSCNSLTFLIGAGCSFSAGLPLMEQLTNSVYNSEMLHDVSKTILNEVKTKFATSDDANIEDFLSEITDLLAIADRRADRGVETNSVTVGNAEYTADELRRAGNEIKRTIACLIGKTVKIDTHRDFVAAVHRPIRVGRRNASEPVDYLVLNYDTIIEDALALEAIPYTDGLQGGVSAWWRPDVFESPDLAARVFKLHGSIDWYQLPNDNLPRRVNPSVEIEDRETTPLLIWPSSTKYQETQLDPFAQLMDRARDEMKPRGNTQRLLVICGYSFGDKHINLELDNWMRESNGNLTIVAFTDQNEPNGQLEKWLVDDATRPHILIFANKGFYHEATKYLFKNDVPWWKFEILTRIMQGVI